MRLFIHYLVLSIIGLFLVACEEDLQISPYKVIAHQGHWRAAEGASNSIRGLEEAVRVELDGVELDVRKTADDSLVLCHNAEHGRYHVANSSFKELRTIRLADGSLMPTLYEYLQAATMMKPIIIIIDVKTEGEIKDVCDIVNRSGIKEQIHLLAPWSVGQQILEYDPDSCVDCLGASVSPKSLKDAGFSGIDCSIDEWKNHTDWLYEARQVGITTNAYTIKSETDIIWCSHHALDFLTTDIPMECKHYISQ